MKTRTNVHKLTGSKWQIFAWKESGLGDGGHLFVIDNCIQETAICSRSFGPIYIVMYTGKGVIINSNGNGETERQRDERNGYFQ